MASSRRPSSLKPSWVIRHPKAPSMAVRLSVVWVSASRPVHGLKDWGILPEPPRRTDAQHEDSSRQVCPAIPARLWRCDAVATTGPGDGQRRAAVLRGRGRPDHAHRPDSGGLDPRRTGPGRHAALRLRRRPLPSRWLLPSSGTGIASSLPVCRRAWRFGPRRRRRIPLSAERLFFPDRYALGRPSGPTSAPSAGSSSGPLGGTPDPNRPPGGSAVGDESAARQDPDLDHRTPLTGDPHRHRSSSDGGCGPAPAWRGDGPSRPGPVPRAVCRGSAPVGSTEIAPARSPGPPGGHRGSRTPARSSDRPVSLLSGVLRWIFDQCFTGMIPRWIANPAPGRTRPWWPL